MKKGVLFIVLGLLLAVATPLGVTGEGEPELTTFGKRVHSIADALDWDVVEAPDYMGGFCLDRDCADVFMEYRGPIAVRWGDHWLIFVSQSGQVDQKLHRADFILYEGWLGWIGTQPIDTHDEQRMLTSLLGFEYPKEDGNGNPIVEEGVVYTLVQGLWPLTEQEYDQLVDLVQTWPEE